MPRSLEPYQKKLLSSSFHQFFKPVREIAPEIPILESRGDRPLKMTFEDQLKILVFYHLEEHVSARHMLQVLEQDDFARENIAPEGGIKKSSFSEAISTRGIEQLQSVFEKLSRKAAGMLPNLHPELGDLVAIDGSLITATLSMLWADYRKGSKKAKIHLGFDLNHAIPSKIYFTDGKGAERPFVSPITLPGQTAVADRGYQEHGLFDSMQAEGKSFVIRIRAKTTKTVVQKNEIKADCVFYDAEVLLGTVQNKNQSQKPVRLVGYHVNGVNYWIATDRRDLTAEQIAEIYKLRWNIENLFAWWKRHLRVYHLIARSPYGLMVQILAGLITYLLLAIYCHENHNEPVNIKRVRELRLKIQNELRASEVPTNTEIFKEQKQQRMHAKT
ncbi:MAG: IS4 family transposase [Desulfobacteraceae bacterium]|nr:IS4 family transposase [Desulfobacteraceae bacterium]